MKPNYKNWVPKGMLISFFVGTCVVGVLLLFAVLTDFLPSSVRNAAQVVLGVGFALLMLASAFLLNMHDAFSYDGKKQYSRRIIDKVSDYVVLPKNGVGLDVGCGSGALTIACAKKNRQATMVGLDRWGKEYASFSKSLCLANARAEGVEDITSFVHGDACKLNFPDEQFDAVTSNYCYHNIPSRDRQAIILETLRVLKKGGTFAIHDYFTKGKYGDIDQLVKKLKDMGYEKVELLDTDDGLFLTRKEAGSVALTGSKLLVGIK